MPKSTDSFNSVEKALKILVTLTLCEEGLGTGEISEQLGFSMPTVSRLLNVLSKHGFVRKSALEKKYVLGSSAFDMGRRAYKHIGAQLIPIARPLIESLRDEIEESTMLEVLKGDHTIIIYRVNGPHVVDIFVGEGTMIPAHVSAGAKAILAFSPPKTLDGILKNKLPRYTPKTITHPEELKKEFNEIRKRGVAFANGEYNLDVMAAGAPIFDHKKRPVAAVVVTMPEYRSSDHKQSRIPSLLKNTAASISKLLLQDWS